MERSDVKQRNEAVKAPEIRAEEQEKSKADVKNMTEGSPFRILLTFSLPLLAGNILQQLYNMVDSSVAGKFIGMNALGAVSNGYMIVLLITTLFSGLSVGGTVLIAQYYGKKDMEGVGRAVNSIYFGVTLLCFPLMIIGCLSARPLLQLFRVPEEILPDAVIYVQVIFLGVPGGLGYNVNAGILNGFGDSRTALRFLAIACIGNLILDVIFVAVFKLGVFGTALATILAQYVSWLLSLRHLNRAYPGVHIRISRKYVDYPIVKKALRIGIPSSISGLQYTVGMMLVQSLVNSYGVDFIAGVNAASKIDGFVFMPILSFSTAVSTFAAQNMGASRIDRVEEGTKAGLLLTTGVCAGIALLFVPFGRPLLRLLFSLTDSATETAMMYLYCVMAPSFWLSVSYVINGTLRGVGCLLVSTISGIVALWIVHLPAAYFLAGQFGPQWLFLSYPIGWTAGIMISGIYYLRGKWKNRRLLEE